jgi:hypothetical protein
MKEADVLAQKVGEEGETGRGGLLGHFAETQSPNLPRYSMHADGTKRGQCGLLELGTLSADFGECWMSLLSSTYALTNSGIAGQKNEKRVEWPIFDDAGSSSTSNASVGNRSRGPGRR